MHETVTMKKTRLQPFIPVLCAVGAVVLFIVTKHAVQAYLLGRSMGTLEF